MFLQVIAFYYSCIMAAQVIRGTLNLLVQDYQGMLLCFLESFSFHEGW